jgi:tRNA (guanosine-2'-O-)-methyltransferase
LAKSVSQGVEKWIDYEVHATTGAACLALREQGFTLVGADLNGVAPEALPAYPRIGVVMGAEKAGLSDEARSHCEAFVTVPMVGLVESFNVSVAAALLLQGLSKERKGMALDRVAQDELFAAYLIQSVSRPEVILAEASRR